MVLKISARGSGLFDLMKYDEDDAFALTKSSLPMESKASNWASKDSWVGLPSHQFAPPAVVRLVSKNWPEVINVFRPLPSDSRPSADDADRTTSAPWVRR